MRTCQDWTLWASRRAAGDSTDQERQRLRLSSIYLTEDGVLTVDLWCPSAREVLQGSVGAAYLKEGVVVATDGSLKHDGAMGVAFVALGDKVPACSAGVFGSEASIQPELTGLAMALEECPVQEDLTLLIDSKSSMDLLQSMQRVDFPLWLYRHLALHLLGHVASLIYQLAAAGVVTRLVKVKAHAGDHTSRAELHCSPHRCCG